MTKKRLILCVSMAAAIGSGCNQGLLTPSGGGGAGGSGTGGDNGAAGGGGSANGGSGGLGGTAGSANGGTNGGGQGGSSGADGGTVCATDASTSDQAGAACGIGYPPSGFYGQNILFAGCTSVGSQAQYEMAADVSDPQSLVVTWTLLAGDPWGFNGMSDWRSTVLPGRDAGSQQTFQPTHSGRNEVEMVFAGTSGQARIDYYECGSQVPTRTQFITY